MPVLMTLTFLGGPWECWKGKIVICIFAVSSRSIRLRFYCLSVGTGSCTTTFYECGGMIYVPRILKNRFSFAPWRLFKCMMITLLSFKPISICCQNVKDRLWLANQHATMRHTTLLTAISIRQFRIIFSVSVNCS